MARQAAGAALVKMPVGVEQLLRDGIAHHQAGRLGQAEACYRQILALQPGHIDALQLMGVIAHQLGRNDLAIDWIGKAIAANPNVAGFHNNLGEAYRGAGDLDRAANSYRRAIALMPGLAEAQMNLIRVLRQQAQQDEALKAMWTALDLGHDALPFVIEIMMRLDGEFKFDDSIALARSALLKRPDDARLLVALGNTLHAAGQLSESLTAYDRAIAIMPGAAEAHWNKALVHLTLGDYLTGWEEYEWRWRCKNFPYQKQNFPQPTWDGSDLQGKTILLDAEGGFGDIIQFVRYARLLAARNGRVLLGSPPDLKELLQSVEGVHQIITKGDALPPFDLQLQLLSCPLRFETRLETIPNNGPYIAAPLDRIKLFEQRIGGDANRLQVGLVWRGRHMPYPNRSCPLEACAPLFVISDVRFHSLQRDDGRAELRSAPAEWGIVDQGDALRDFSDTAGLIANLDLVITIDSAVAHLAGAMGKRAWVMLPHSPDWRWMTGRDDCPWYPTMKLFRQTSPGDWRGVTSRVAEALKQV